MFLFSRNGVVLFNIERQTACLIAGVYQALLIISKATFSCVLQKSTSFATKQVYSVLRKITSNDNIAGIGRT